MCLAIPVQVTELLPDDMAKVSLDGVTKVDLDRLGRGPEGRRLRRPARRLRLDEDRPGGGRAHARAVRLGREPAAMKYVDEYRDGALAQTIAAAIRREADPAREYHFMEFCGGHTHAISRYGLEDLLPPNVKMIHGPGCPVCVLPVARIDMAIACARRPEVTLCIYGDLMRVPGSDGMSLMKAKAEGADIRMVYSTLDALRIAEKSPEREVVFFAIGFETTTPPTALAIRAAAKKGLTNFSVLCNHVLTPAAIQTILQSPDVRELGSVKIDGFIGPAHVSTVIGLQPYRFFAEEFEKPVVVAGFEPLDVAQAILMLVRQINEGRARGREPIHPRRQRIRQREGAGRSRRSVRAARALRMARPRRRALRRAEAARRLRALRRRAALRPRREAGARQSGLRMRRDPARGQEAARLQAVRNPVHARHADGLVHGVAGRRLRGPLDLRPLPRGGQSRGRAREDVA